MTKKSEAKTAERTVSDALAGAPVTVSLGGREYEIYPKKGKKHTRGFRARLAPILTMAQQQAGVQDGQLAVDIASVLNLLGPELDEYLDIVYEWSPEIAADRAFLEGEEIEGEGSTDAEFLVALIEIAGLVYGPFASALGLMGPALQAGTGKGLTPNGGKPGSTKQ